jgi:hypothetical protein
MQDLMRFLRVFLVDAVERPDETSDDLLIDDPLRPIMNALGNYVHFIQLAKLGELRASEVALLHQAHRTPSQPLTELKA